MSENETPAEEKSIPPQDLVPWAEFLEDYPINTVQNVSAYYERIEEKYGNPFRRLAPVLRLHCYKCEGIRNFWGEWTHHETFSKGGESCVIF